MPTLCLRLLVDTLFCVKWLARLSIFVRADILVLVSEFLVAVILSEWWLVPTTVGRSLRKHSFTYLLYILYNRLLMFQVRQQGQSSPVDSS